MPTTRLTIYLLRDVATPADAISADKSPKQAALDPASGLEGEFFYAPRAAVQPSWVGFVQPVVIAPLTGLTSASASGLLILKAAGEFFAFTFGYGRSFLDPSKIEHQFGLRVALNRIDASQIRSLDTKTFEDMVVTKNVQTSKSAELPNFGVDVSRDILRAVTGQPRDRSVTKRLSGSDALVLSANVTPAGLAALCADLLAAFHEVTYKTDFEWIDQLALVNDDATIDALDTLLEAQLIAGDTSQTHMAVPETIDWEDIDVFKIGGTFRTTYEDLDLDEYLGQLGPKKSEITIDRLKSRPVSVRFTRSTDFDTRWNVYQCLITEQRHSGQLHVLIEGRWFAVSDSIVADVDTFANSLPASPLALISSAKGEKEGDYNKRLANSDPDELLLLDAHIKRPGGAASGIELCDVLASSGEFIHVKRKSRSSTLSHLFAQGAVSASTFNGDGVFRDEIRNLIASAVPPVKQPQWMDLVPANGSPVDKSKYLVSYVVIANSSKTGTDWLPFFSKLNLMQHGKQLRDLGFTVSITRVDSS